MFFRGSIPYFYPSFTLSLQATDNASLSMIILNDTGTPTVFHVDGTTVEVSLTVGAMGLHTLQYYSVDAAGNKETAHNKHAAIARPELTDLIETIDNSNIDNDGIKNALKSKIRTAHQLEWTMSSTASTPSLTSYKHSRRNMGGFQKRSEYLPT